MTLTEFLTARIADDETAADCVGCKPSDGLGPYNPDRIKAECKAKRQIIESVDVLTSGEKTYMERLLYSDVEDAHYQIVRDILRWLALPYADHPDFQEEWRA